MADTAIPYLMLSQEDLIQAGAFDIPMAIQVVRPGLKVCKVSAKAAEE